MNCVAVRVVALISIFVPYLCGAKEPGIAVEWDPSHPNEKTAAIWLAYLLARQAYRIDHSSTLPQSGEIVPSFDEEVSARNTTAQVYSELKEKDKQLRDSYWDALVQIKAKGFMDAYVWTYLRRPEWPNEKPPANLAAFENWRNANLKEHKPQTIGRLSVQTK